LAKKSWRESEEPLGMNSYCASSKQPCACWLLIGQKKSFVLFCPRITRKTNMMNELAFV